MPMFLIPGLGPVVVQHRPKWRTFLWTPHLGQPDWWRAIRRKGVRFIHPEVNPDGLPFIRLKDGASMLYLEIPRGSLNGWLLERMPDGSWAYVRKATTRDCLAIHDAYAQAVAPDPDAPDPRPVVFVDHI